MDLESVGSTNPMPVDSDTASLDAFPTNVVIYNDPLPQADGCDGAITEVMVISHGGTSEESAHDAPRATVHDLSIPLPADADAEAPEARHLALLAEGRKLASMRRLTEAHRREADRAAFGTPPPGRPSRAGVVRQHGAALADTLGVDRQSTTLH